MLIRLWPSKIVVTYNWTETRICPRHNCTHKQYYCTRNFVPTIVPRRDCAHMMMRVFSRQLDTQCSWYINQFAVCICLWTSTLKHKFVYLYKGKLGTNVSGHKPVWTQMFLVTNVLVTNVLVTNVSGTNVSGHKRFWSQTCWSQTCLGTNVTGH